MEYSAQSLIAKFKAGFKGGMKTVFLTQPKVMFEKSPDAAVVQFSGSGTTSSVKIVAPWNERRKK